MRREVCHDTNDYVVTGGAGLASRHGSPRAAIRHPTPYDTAQGRCNTTCGKDLCRDTVCIVTRGEGRDAATRRRAGGLGVVHAQRAGSQGLLGVNPVHPTQF